MNTTKTTSLIIIPIDYLIYFKTPQQEIHLQLKELRAARPPASISEASGRSKFDQQIKTIKYLFPYRL